MKKEFKYFKYNPSGNITALVEGTNINSDLRKDINDKIMGKDSSIEQVGFINNEKYELVMAGGEFCGNATRCAAYHYLKGNIGEIKIIVSKNKTVKSGIDSNKNTYTEMPLLEESSRLIKLDVGIYNVKMDGINHIIIDEETSKKYILDIENMKTNAMNLIEKYNINDAEAMGVIFTQRVNDNIKIHPVIWVKNINTLFYENSCGSGTTSCVILEALLNKESKTISIIQPSNEILTAQVDYKEGKIENAILYGEIKEDKTEYKVSIEM